MTGGNHAASRRRGAAAAATPSRRRPEYRSRRSRDRSCSLTIRLIGSRSRPATRSTPMALSDDAGDHVGAYRTVGRDGSSPSDSEDGVAVDAAVDQAVHLRHADQADRRAVVIDRPGGDEVPQPSLVDEEEPVPLAHRPGRRIEPVLPADAVEDLDPAGAARQRRPHEIGRHVRVELHQGGAARMDRPYARGLAVDRGHARRLLARGEVQLHARVALEGADDGSHHREVDRRPAVDEDPALFGPPADPRVEPTEAVEGGAQSAPSRADLLHADSPRRRLS